MIVIAIDMDDTICDFKGARRRRLDEEPGMLYPQSQYGFFRNLEPLPDAIEYIDKLKQYFEVHILTRPSIYNPLSYSEKREWVEKYLGFDMCEHLTLTSHKDRYIADYLVDDMIWKGFTGYQIVYGTGQFHCWKNVYDFIMKREY